MPLYKSGITNDEVTFRIYFYPRTDLITKDKVIMSITNSHNSNWHISGYTQIDKYTCRNCGALYTVKNGISVDSFDKKKDWDNKCSICGKTDFKHEYKFPEIDMLVEDITSYGLRNTLGKMLGTKISFTTYDKLLLERLTGEQRNIARTREAFRTQATNKDEDRGKTFTPLGEVSDEIADMLKKTNRNIKRAESMRSYRETQPKQTFGLGTEGKNKLDNVFDFTITNLGIQKGTRLYNNLKTAYGIEISNALIKQEYVTKKREDVTNEMTLRVIDWIMEYVYFNKNIKY